MPINEAVSPPPIAEPTKILIKLTIPTSGCNCNVKGNKTTIPKITPNPGNIPIITPDKTEANINRIMRGLERIVWNAKISESIIMYYYISYP